MMTCRSCGQKLERTFVDLGMSPLSNAFLTPDKTHRMEPFYPLHAHVCEHCLLVQLEEFESPEHIFSDYPYFSSYSDSWLQHAQVFVDEASRRFSLNGNSKIVEVASNDGYLLQYFKRKKIPVLGIEPAANVAAVAESRGIPTRVAFFGRAAAADLVKQGIRANLLVANNVLAHVPNVNDFVGGMQHLLAVNGVITIEFPYIARLIEQNQFDTIYHEHFSYFSLIAATRLLERHKLRVFDVDELTTHGGSLRLYVCHLNDALHAESPRVSALHIFERDHGYQVLSGYTDFAPKVAELKRRLLELLIDIKKCGKQVVGYGAPAKGNTLLNYCGIRTDFIDYTVDRNPHKQGLFLPGTHIPVYEPERIKLTQPDFVLILPWNLGDEIVSQLSFVRNWGGKFIVPIPEPRVVS